MFNYVELELNQQGPSASEQPQKRLGSKTTPTLVTSVVQLLRKFNDDPAASTQKEARSLEQPQRNDIGNVETPTNTTVASIGTSAVGWKAGGEKRGVLLRSNEGGEERDRSEQGRK
jgi:hypothetical protein